MAAESTDNPFLPAASKPSFKFFFDQDRKKTLESRVEGLAKVVYHNKLGSQAERSEGLGNCRDRAQAIAQRIARWRQAEGDKGGADEFVRWVEIIGNSLQLHATPLSIAEIFRKQVTENSRSWVFTSATLSVNGDFKHYCGELGLDEAQLRAWREAAAAARLWPRT